MDKTLLTNLANAIRARPIIEQLPDGDVREHARQFERLCLDDFREQIGLKNLTNQEILAVVEATVTTCEKKLLSLAINYAISALKKHYPALALSSLSGLISYLASK